MVVLAASILHKSGKVLVSRQFVDMTRMRIEGLLAAFPKLIGTGKQHTYVETENVRYVYQPMEALYLLLITNKQSNILEDLDTLRILSKLENVTVAQVKQYCEMESHEEKLHRQMREDKIREAKDEMKRKANEIDKNKIIKNRGDNYKGGFGPLQSMGSGIFENSFNDTSISSSGTGSRLSSDVDSFSTKSKARPTSAATAPPKGLGMTLGKSKRTNQFLESLKAEGEVIVEDVRPTLGKSQAAAPPPTDPITLTVEEKLNVTLKRDGGVSNFDVQGSLCLQILNQEDGHVQVQVQTGENQGVSFKTHPNMNKELFANENILGLRDANRPFPTGQSGDAGIGLLKWRMQSTDEKMVPLIINCWPSSSGNQTYVNIEYEASSMFDLQNVVISVPLPALREAPSVNQIDGEWRYDPRNSILEWSVILIDNSNRSGSLEFVVPQADSSSFFPIAVRFMATNTFSNLKVTNIIPVKGGNPPKFSQRTQLITENYQVV
ncbi:coatomer subunit delta isoform X2 [Arachis hypogaea]|uniref:coatomer subunit delta isoform X2 n=1 Tax=Arachis hypogaea TaxID=3818 RepID=UPI000DEC3F91|nr:coatomer subunit delta isoform X2 [Arachis hypogaea]